MKHFATITVIGRDKTGVIARVTGFLFAQRANIEAMEEQVTRGHFSMTIQASWSHREMDSAAVETGLEELGKALRMQIKARFTEPRKRQRTAIFVTRESHCFEGLIKAFKSRQIKADVAVVISNHRDLESLATKAGLKFFYVPWDDRTKAEELVLQLLDDHEVDFVILARFMKILSAHFVWHYKNKIINIHPSMLPSFPGAQAYRQAYEHGVKIAGVTAHFVSMHLDEGPIIAQSSFAIRPGMDLKQILAAGQKLETPTLIRAIRLYLSQRLDVYWGVVKEI